MIDHSPFMRPHTLSLALTLFILPICLSLQRPAASPPSDQSLPEYPDKAGGLKKLMQDILKTAKSGDQQVLEAYTKSLVISDPDTWFRRIFGDVLGEKFATDYRGSRGRLPAELSDFFSAVLQAQMADIEVHRFERSCDRDADEFLYPLLAARVQQEPLYKVVFRRGTYGRALSALAYIGGGFRYVGDLRVSPAFPAWKLPTAAGPEAASKGIEVGGNAQKARLIRQVAPDYPIAAKRARLQGTVRLAAIIGTDGTVRDIRVLQGHCWLAEPAVEAVKRWRYSPTMLEGEPVEVLTTIDVVFSLSIRP